MADKDKSVAKTNSKKPEILNIDFNKFLDLEHKRIDIERIREENVTKELESSAESSKEALELAKEDLGVNRMYIENTFSFKKTLAWMGFVLLLLLLGGGVVLILYLSKNNIDVLDRLFSFLKDMLKIITGFALGFSADIIRTRSKKKKDNE